MALYLTEAELEALDEGKQAEEYKARKAAEKESKKDDANHALSRFANARYGADIRKYMNSVTSHDAFDADAYKKDSKQYIKDIKKTTKDAEAKDKERAKQSDTYKKAYNDIRGFRGSYNYHNNPEKVSTAARVGDTIDRHNRRHPDRKVLESGIFESVEII